MDIHQQIKAARERKQWSMERLAKEISSAEGLKKELAWQTVQQWENGTSAPKRTRMGLVKQLLDIEERKPAPNAPGQRFDELKPEEQAMLNNYRVLLDKDRDALNKKIEELARERQAEFDEFQARLGVRSALERSHARKSQAATASVDPNDLRLKQRSLIDPPPVDE